MVGRGYLSRADLIKRLRDAEEEVKRLREENRLLKKLVENLDDELISCLVEYHRF